MGAGELLSIPSVFGLCLYAAVRGFSFTAAEFVSIAEFVWVSVERASCGVCPAVLSSAIGGWIVGRTAGFAEGFILAL